MADGALNEVHDILKRMNELSIQAANGTLTNEDRAQIQEEIDALVSEIDRIGDDTTFNEHQIFDGREAGMVDNGSIADLILSPSAEQKYLKEAYHYNGYYYPMGSLDFKNITSSNLSYLNNGSFSFNCSQNCSEVFNIKFITDSDGTSSSCSSLDGAVPHYYNVDISDCTSGTDIVDKIYNYINANPTKNGSSSSPIPGIKVSHSNNLIKDGSRLLVVANGYKYSSESDAKNLYPKNGIPSSGLIECTALRVPKPAALVKNFTIQCSSDKNDIEKIQICQMNTKVLNLEQLNVSTQQSAQNAMTKVQDANDTISRHRSILGAMQNRLEHAYSINEISSENTSTLNLKSETLIWQMKWLHIPCKTYSLSLVSP